MALLNSLLGIRLTAEYILYMNIFTLQLKVCMQIMCQHRAEAHRNTAWLWEEHGCSAVQLYRQNFSRECAPLTRVACVHDMFPVYACNQKLLSQGISEHFRLLYRWLGFGTRKNSVNCQNPQWFQFLPIHGRGIPPDSKRCNKPQFQTVHYPPWLANELGTSKDPGHIAMAAPDVGRICRNLWLHLKPRA